MSVSFGEMLKGGSVFLELGRDCCSDRRVEIPEVPCGLTVIFPGMLSSLLFFFPRLERFTPIKMWEMMNSFRLPGDGRVLLDRGSR